MQDIFNVNYVHFEILREVELYVNIILGTFLKGTFRVIKSLLLQVCHTICFINWLNFI